MVSRPANGGSIGQGKGSHDGGGLDADRGHQRDRGRICDQGGASEVKREDVKVTVEDGVLTIQGERKQEKGRKGEEVSSDRTVVRPICPDVHATRLGR